MQENTCVFCHGRMIRVTRNCLSALKHLRLNSPPRTLWIGAICIDQSSFKERNQEVSRMGYIYEASSRVLIWLGEGANYTGAFL